MKIIINLSIITIVLINFVTAPPPRHIVKEKKDDNSKENEIDEEQPMFDVEYKRYLQEVVQVLESDDDFKNRLVKANPDDIKSGKIAHELEFVNHNVRSKLDELKRQELERLRLIAIAQYEKNNGIERHHRRLPGHIDPKNPHTFEAEDLRKLIVQTTKELEDADKERRKEFKEYEMNKEMVYQEQLNHLSETDKTKAQKDHEESIKKHKQHPNLHHPGSKQQYEEVWEKQDHLSPEDFNPKTFFHMHDLDGNGVWDANEVKALFKKELDKMYDPNAPEDDIRERYEEMERMREHVFNESDVNKDQLISYKEFLEQTKKQEYERDDGWEGLDQQQQIYSEDEYKDYAKTHEAEIRRMMEQGLIPQAPPGYVPMIIPPGHDMPYHPGGQYPPQNIPPNGMHPGQGHGGQQGQYNQYGQPIPHPGQYQQHGSNQQPPHQQQIPQQYHPQQDKQQYHAPPPQQGQQQYHAPPPQQGQQQYHAPPPLQDQQQYHAPPPQRGQQQQYHAPPPQQGHPQQQQQLHQPPQQQEQQQQQYHNPPPPQHGDQQQHQPQATNNIPNQPNTGQVQPNAPKIETEAQAPPPSHS